jgi:hypothetical protein
MLHALIGRYSLIAAICFVATGPTVAQTSNGPSSPAPPTAPDKRADANMPRNGVIHPAPGGTADSMVKPPNVDPGMTIPPPGTPGNGEAVVPK